jgi:hypothetical protein
MYLPVKLKDGGEVYVEVAPTPGAVAAARESDLVLEGHAMGGAERAAGIAQKAEKQFADAVQVAQSIAEEVDEGLVKKEGASRRLSEVAVELSLGFTAQGNVFVAQTGASAALKLTLKWSLPK